MAKTLLNGVNETFKQLSLIAGDAAELASLTDSARQSWIDSSVQSWNEAIDEVYSLVGLPLPNVMTEATITLVASDRDYALASDLVRLYFPLLDKTNGRYIVEYPGGYMAMFNDQPQPANWTGLPWAAAIRPSDGELYLDRIPQSAEAGLVYTYRYEKDTALESASDTVPFTDATFRAMVPAVAQLMNAKMRQSFDAGIYGMSIGRAGRLLRKQPQNTSWLPG